MAEVRATYDKSQALGQRLPTVKIPTDNIAVAGPLPLLYCRRRVAARRIRRRIYGADISGCWCCGRSSPDERRENIDFCCSNSSSVTSHHSHVFSSDTAGTCRVRNIHTYLSKQADTTVNDQSANYRRMPII